ncbi:MAG: UvrD-helicase domain-containing protein [Cellvibrionales bacterium]|nr:UvrD-helicase domain-containing protein [Cellvibrionales bacterium]
MSATLDARTFPLRGSQLIEASAGTGKTYTIALLYVRLVLGHGDQSSAFTRPLLPPDILVVTFTDAASQELRDRIRARLSEAADIFSGIRTLQEGDPLAFILADYPPDQRPACALKLQRAAEWMDEAAISTIHSWCYRMLREHAFDSNSLFTQELVTDQSDLLIEIAEDYWRKFFMGWIRQQLGCFTAKFPARMNCWNLSVACCINQTVFRYFVVCDWSQSACHCCCRGRVNT